jgi:hypothetical protein
MGHAAVRSAILQEFDRGFDDRILIGAHQSHDARRDPLRSLGDLAQDQHRYPKAGCLLL